MKVRALQIKKVVDSISLFCPCLFKFTDYTVLYVLIFTEIIQNHKKNGHSSFNSRGSCMRVKLIDGKKSLQPQ